MLDRIDRPEPEIIDIASLVRDEALRPRAGTDEATVVEYRRTMREGAKFPPVDVVETPDGALRLVDGFHRVEAAEREGRAEISAGVWIGASDDAIEFAAYGAGLEGSIRLAGQGGPEDLVDSGPPGASLRAARARVRLDRS